MGMLGRAGICGELRAQTLQLPKILICDSTRVFLNKIPQHQTPGSTGSTRPCGASQKFPQSSTGWEKHLEIKEGAGEG